MFGNVSSGSSVLLLILLLDLDKLEQFFQEQTEYDYTSKSINQFFGCQGIVSSIKATDNIRSDQTYFGYEDGDTSKKVELIITGSISDFIQISENLKVDEGDNNIC